MRKIEVEVFKFEELKPKPKEKAKEKYNFDYSDLITENFMYYLESRGYGDCKLEWSLGYCQGDGVAFYGKVDVSTWWKKRGRTLFSKEEKKKLYAEYARDSDICIGIKRNSFGNHYSHYNTMYVDVEWDSALAQMVETAILDDIRDISKELARMGYKDIEYYTSDECFQETAEANDYEFFADGTLV